MHSISRRQALGAITGAAMTGAISIADERLSIRLATFRTEVTVPTGHPLMGGGIAPAKRVEDPLFALGWVLLGAGKPIVYVAVDWCEIRNDAYDRWRQVIADAVGTDRVRVMVSALHQHDAPISDLAAQKLLEKYGAKGAICNLEFHELAVQRVAKAAKKSLESATSVTHIGTGQAKVEKVASNRRFVDETGKVRYDRMSRATDAKIRAAEEGTIDPFIKTMTFWSGETAIVTMNSYATHPMSYYGGGEVSTDFVGMARKRREAETPKTMQMYMSGCSGNVTAGKYNDGSRDNRSVLADRIHQAMKTASTSTKKHTIEKASFRSVPLQLAARTSTGFGKTELLYRVRNDNRPFGQCLAALGFSWLQRVDSGQPIDIPVIDFGSAQIAVLPAESYVEYQLFAQSVRPDTFTMIAGYGECGPGYIPIERAWKENDGNLHDWCWVDPGSEARMKEAITRALRG
jgi:hypothetical protein